jgi:hypothetical protein
MTLIGLLVMGASLAALARAVRSIQDADEVTAV